MLEGTCTFYTIQHKTTGQSPWLRPEEPIIPKLHWQGNWVFSSFDHFGMSFDPHEGVGNNRHAVDQAASNEIHAIWSKTGHKGWRSLRHAKSALRRVRSHDNLGKYNGTDTHGNVCQAVRHEFRIVKIIISCKMDLVPEAPVKPAKSAAKRIKPENLCIMCKVERKKPRAKNGRQPKYCEKCQKIAISHAGPFVKVSRQVKA